MGLSATYYQYIIQLNDKFSGALQKAGNNASGTYSKLINQQNLLNNSTSQYGSILKTIVPLISIGAIVQFGRKSIEAWDGSALALENVKAGILSTGNAANRTLKQFTDAASAFQNTTVFDDDGILQNVTAQLQTFTNISGLAFDRAQQSALDVTSKLYGVKAASDDLKGVSIQLGKALNDPVSNLSALGRSGIQFDENQEKLIKSLWKSGQQAKAQSLILDELNRQYGGTAAALANTDFGRYIQSQNRINDSMERMGQIIAPVRLQFSLLAEKMLTGLVKIVYWIIENKNWITTLAATIGTYLGVLKLWQIGQAAVIATIALYKAIVFIVIAMTRGWAVAQRALNIAMIANPIGLIVAAIAALAVGIYMAWQKSEKFRGALIAMWNVMKLVGKTIKDVFVNTIKDILKGFGYLFDAFKALLHGNFKEAGKLAMEGFKNLSIINPIKNTIAGAKNIGANAGKEWRSGFEKGKSIKPKGINIPGFTGNGTEQSIAGYSNQNNLSKDLSLTGSSITSGGSKPVNINITLGKLNEKIEVHTTNLKEGLQDIESQFEEMFLRVLNSSAKLQTQ